MERKALLRNAGAAGLILFCLLLPAAVSALTPEQVIALKKAGVSEETIQLMIRQEEAARNHPEDTMGRREVRDAQGNTVIIYSTGSSPRANGNDEEKKKLESSWRMLENMVVKPAAAE
ncbi:MAG: hypothetical protein M0009_08420 [Deltaproteobacteria bacterium]|nr:hypothetical protein [Deltaproteobacteria bacterium]